MNSPKGSAPAKIENLRIFSGSANRPLAQAVAGQLGINLSPVMVTHLPDSEIHVQIDEVVRDQDIFLMMI